ncbi:PREDICTED: kinesin-related protein 4-like [Ipomoea nil]|uniref:kinesin-related protein 4-like n=1 Tax=Ipomoea nil TaxID=35883 RepID=UPI000901A3D7|nr:PREDICTED: kinesin-related protein 4-like [Ipomoea nil]
MEIWNVLMELGEGDEQEKDNKLTVAMKKFEDFKMLPNETIMDMELRFTRLMGDLTDLGKELTEKERNLKILRGLPKSWEMKVIAMRDNRDMKTTSTAKIFSDLKAYEFEHEPKDAEESETRNIALMANQSASTSNSKHQDSNTSKSPSKETRERYKRNDKPKSSGSRNERRRKAMVVNETSDTVVKQSSSSSSSSDDESSEEEKGLLCLFSQESEDLCLTADEDEVNSHSSSCYLAESSSVGSQTSNESVTEMMRRFKVINSTYSKLKEENSRLTISYNALRQVRIENIKLAIAKEQLEKNVLTLKEQCTVRERREQELLEVLDKFNNSSNLMDRMINDSRLPGERTGIGFNPSSASQTCLNKSTNAYSHEGFQAAFVQGPTQRTKDESWTLYVDVGSKVDS